LVALIEAARAARAEAERLRVDARSLRAATHASTEAVRAKTAQTAAAAAVAEETRPRTLPSAWSSLHWRREDPELEHVLVAVRSPV
jgi:hypothetical protein